MSRKTLTTITLFCLLLHLAAQALASEPLTDEERARRTQELSRGLRLSQKVMFHSGYLFIRDLVRSHQSNNYRLTMTNNQEVTIVSLDKLLLEAKFAAMDRDADYLETNPRDYEACLARSKQRQYQAIHHGQFMTFTGLLTPTQSRYVMRDYISGRKWRSFHIDLIQELFDLNDVQKKQLSQARADYYQSKSKLIQLSLRPGADRDDIQAGIQLFREEYRQAALEILNPAQRKKYDQLKIRPPYSEVLPPTPPLSPADRKRLDLSQRSPVFRDISRQRDQLNLTSRQSDLLERFIQITQRGLLWIETTRTPQPADAPQIFAHTQATFLKHAEQVALQGILSEQQAQQVLDAR